MRTWPGVRSPRRPGFWANACNVHASLACGTRPRHRQTQRVRPRSTAIGMLQRSDGVQRRAAARGGTFPLNSRRLGCRLLLAGPPLLLLLQQVQFICEQAPAIQYVGRPASRAVCCLLGHNASLQVSCRCKHESFSRQPRCSNCLIAVQSVRNMHAARRSPSEADVSVASCSALTLRVQSACGHSTLRMRCGASDGQACVWSHRMAEQ